MKRRPSTCPRCNRALRFIKDPAGRWRACNTESRGGRPLDSQEPPALTWPAVRGLALHPGSGQAPARWCTVLDQRGPTVAECFLVHRATCPAVRQAAKAEQDAELRGSAPSTWGWGYCRRERGGCGAAMRWGRTSGGKNVPLDPEPIGGPELDADEVRQLKGSPDLVRGYDRHGQVRCIRRPGSTPGLFDATRPTVWVWVTHWATCPNRDVLREGSTRR